MAKWSSQHNGKYPDPYSKIKLDEEKKVKKKKKKKDKDKNRDSILSSLDPNTNTKVNLFIHRAQTIWKAMGIQMSKNRSTWFVNAPSF